MTTTDHALRDALKPCPFCGGKQIFVAPDRSHGDTVWEVGCKACYAIITRDLESHAIAAWNIRATTPTPDGVEEAIARIRAAVEEREAGVQRDIRRWYIGVQPTDADIAYERSVATVSSLRLDDLQMILSLLQEKGNG